MKEKERLGREERKIGEDRKREGWGLRKRETGVRGERDREVNQDENEIIISLLCF